MIDRLAWLSSAVGLRAWAPATEPRRVSPIARCRAWIPPHREHLWLGVILIIAALAHGMNMFHLPYFENDEGTYMSQAWSVLNEGQLAPYTYWYDHAPLGWIQIAGWTLISGGMSAFGPSIYSGRVFMLLLQVGSAFMLYMIARRVSGSIFVASLTTLAFSLSAWGIYYHRRVLLDNITTFWMLLSIFFLVSPRVSLRRVWLSGAALGVSALSKELTVFLFPVMALLVFDRASKGQRAFALTTWIAIVGSVISLYPLMAVLKGELLPAGHGLFETMHPHTSLLGSANYQGSRGKDGGLFSWSSQFWTMMRQWAQSDPLLVIGGSLASILNTLRIFRNRLIGVMGLLTLSLYAFLARGGEVLGFYLVPLLPLFALNLGLVVQMVTQGAARRVARWPAARRGLLLTIGGAVIAVYARLIVADYQSPELSFASNPLQLWTSNQSVAQVQAMAWVRSHIPPRDCIIVDDYMWTDLAAGFDNGPRYTCVHWYWKVDKDTAITGPIFHNRWQTADYVVETGQMLNDAHTKGSGLNIVSAAIAHSAEVKHFDTGGWSIDVRKVIRPGTQVAASRRRRSPGPTRASRAPRASLPSLVLLPTTSDSPLPAALAPAAASARLMREGGQSADLVVSRLADRGRYGLDMAAISESKRFASLHPTASRPGIRNVPTRLAGSYKTHPAASRGARSVADRAPHAAPGRLWQRRARLPSDDDVLPAVHRHSGRRWHAHEPLR